MGNAHKVHGNLDAAIDSYKQAIKINPNFAVSFYNVGITLEDMGDLIAAIDSYKLAIKFKPTMVIHIIIWGMPWPRTVI